LRSLLLIKSTCLFVLFFAIQTLASEKNSYLSHHLKDQSLVITTTLGPLTLSAYSDNAIEAHYQYENKGNNADFLPSFAIKEQSIKQHFSVTDTSQQLILSAGKLNAVINKSPFTISYYQGEKLLVSEEAGFFTGTTLEDKTQHQIQGFRFKLSDNEKLLGGGERVLGMDRRGHRMPLYNRAHYGYETQSNQMNFSLPAVFSSKKYILLFDNSAKGWMDLGKSEEEIMQFEAVSGRMSYLVFSGNTYPELINNYVNVTGKQPMPPRWALGNYASRFGYRSEQEVRDTVNQFIDLDFPLDALILDLYWFGKDIKGHMGNLDWDKEAFPTPTKMISDIKAQGVNTVLITEPFVLTSSKKWADAEKHQALAKNTDGKAKRFDFYFGNTGLVDVFSDKGKSWFNSIYKRLYQQGIAGWWGDLGEPEVHPSDILHTLSDGNVVNGDAIHNVYGHQWAKMVFKNQLELAPNERPFILMRSGFAGSQRFGMIPWTGDVSRSWGGLKPQVELSLQMGVLGMGYTHSDLGGFAGGETFNKELYIRWLQYGVFQPIYRPHAQDNIAPEVVFHDKETQDVLRKFIKLRYNLLPYNYTLAYQNSTTGMPLMRPLFFEYENEYENEDELNLSLMDNATSYFWGNAFLVTPIVDAGVTSVSIPLPKGVWFDYFTDKKYQGDQTISLATRLETLPVLVRAGSFIPMVDDIQSTKDYDSSQLTLHYYADDSVKRSEGEMYEDDGKSFQSLSENQYEKLHFSAKKNRRNKESLGEDHIEFSFNRTGEGYPNMPDNRQVSLVIHHWLNIPKNITIAGNSIEVGANMAASDVYWSKTEKTLTVKFNWQHQPLKLSIEN
jgi:oligosaccharide 4-alpha-D-glucosyltransferase